MDKFDVIDARIKEDARLRNIGSQSKHSAISMVMHGANAINSLVSDIMYQKGNDYLKDFDADYEQKLKDGYFSYDSDTSSPYTAEDSQAKYEKYVQEYTSANSIPVGPANKMVEDGLYNRKANNLNKISAFSIKSFDMVRQQDIDRHVAEYMTTDNLGNPDDMLTEYGTTYDSLNAYQKELYKKSSGPEGKTYALRMLKTSLYLTSMGCSDTEMLVTLKTNESKYIYQNVLENGMSEYDNYISLNGSDDGVYKHLLNFYNKDEIYKVYGVAMNDAQIATMINSVIELEEPKYIEKKNENAKKFNEEVLPLLTGYESTTNVDGTPNRITTPLFQTVMEAGDISFDMLDSDTQTFVTNLLSKNDAIFELQNYTETINAVLNPEGERDFAKIQKDLDNLMLNMPLTVSSLLDSSVPYIVQDENGMYILPMRNIFQNKTVTFSDQSGYKVSDNGFSFQTMINAQNDQKKLEAQMQSDAEEAERKLQEAEQELAAFNQINESKDMYFTLDAQLQFAESKDFKYVPAELDAYLQQEMKATGKTRDEVVEDLKYALTDFYKIASSTKVDGIAAVNDSEKSSILSTKKAKEERIFNDWLKTNADSVASAVIISEQDLCSLATQSAVTNAYRQEFDRSLVHPKSKFNKNAVAMDAENNGNTVKTQMIKDGTYMEEFSKYKEERMKESSEMSNYIYDNFGSVDVGNGDTIVKKVETLRKAEDLRKKNETSDFLEVDKDIDPVGYENNQKAYNSAWARASKAVGNPEAWSAFEQVLLGEMSAKMYTQEQVTELNQLLRNPVVELFAKKGINMEDLIKQEFKSDSVPEDIVGAVSQAVIRRASELVSENPSQMLDSVQMSELRGVIHDVYVDLNHQMTEGKINEGTRDAAYVKASEGKPAKLIKIFDKNTKSSAFKYFSNNSTSITYEGVDALMQDMADTTFMAELIYNGGYQTSSKADNSQEDIYGLTLNAMLGYNETNGGYVKGGNNEEFWSRVTTELKEMDPYSLANFEGILGGTVGLVQVMRQARDMYPNLNITGLATDKRYFTDSDGNIFRPVVNSDGQLEALESISGGKGVNKEKFNNAKAVTMNPVSPRAIKNMENKLSKNALTYSVGVFNDENKGELYTSKYGGKDTAVFTYNDEQKLMIKDHVTAEVESDAEFMTAAKEYTRITGEEMHVEVDFRVGDVQPRAVIYFGDEMPDNTLKLSRYEKDMAPLIKEYIYANDIDGMDGESRKKVNEWVYDTLWNNPEFADAVTAYEESTGKALAIDIDWDVKSWDHQDGRKGKMPTVSLSFK